MMYVGKIRQASEQASNQPGQSSNQSIHMSKF